MHRTTETRDDRDMEALRAPLRSGVAGSGEPEEGLLEIAVLEAAIPTFLLETETSLSVSGLVLTARLRPLYSPYCARLPATRADAMSLGT